jgi:hypothetical protein
MEVDMSSNTSVLAFAAVTIKNNVPILDVLFNAGCSQLHFERAHTGHEKVTQANYYSNALLALELLPFLGATAVKTEVPSRVSWAGSRLYYKSFFLRETGLGGRGEILGVEPEDASGKTGMQYTCTVKVKETGKIGQRDACRIEEDRSQHGT